MEAIFVIMICGGLFWWLIDSTQNKPPEIPPLQNNNVEDGFYAEMPIPSIDGINEKTIDGARQYARHRAAIEHNEFVAIMESHEIEYQKAKEAFGNIRGFLRPAEPANYRAWLEGYISKAGQISHYYDYDMPDKWYIAINDFSIVPLYGAQSVNIIIPKGINVDISAGLGHNNLYYMDDYVHSGFFVPIFNNI